MAFKSKMLGRDAVMRKLRDLVPDAEKEAAKAQIEAADELAIAIKARAPVGRDEGAGDYRASIRGGRIAEAPERAVIGARRSKDPNATGVFANHKWRWLEFGTAERFKKTGASTGQMPAQPHIFPTFRQYRKKIRRKVATAINWAVRKARG